RMTGSSSTTMSLAMSHAPITVSKRLYRGTNQRKGQDHRCPFLAGRTHLNCTVMLANNARRDAQPQPRTRLWTLAGKKRVEHSVNKLRLDSVALVNYPQNEIALGLVHYDVDSAPLRRRITRIRDQIDQH